MLAAIATIMSNPIPPHFLVAGFCVDSDGFRNKVPTRHPVAAPKPGAVDAINTNTTKETLNNSPTRKREAGEADLTGKQAGFFCQIAVFALNFPHFPFSGRTLGVGVE